MTGPAVLLLSVVVLAAGAPPARKAPRKPAPAGSPVATAAPAKTPPPTPTPPTPTPTPTPVPTPSIKESVEFVREKLATYGTYDFEVSSPDAKEAGRVSGLTSVKSFDAGTCVLTLARKLDIETSTVGDPEGDFRDVGDLELRIPLKEVSTSISKTALMKFGVYEVTRGGGLTQLEITGKKEKKPIAVKGNKRMTEGEEKKQLKVNDTVGSTYLIFADEEIATRSKKALEHAIELCQRKKEAF